MASAKRKATVDAQPSKKLKTSTKDLSEQQIRKTSTSEQHGERRPVARSVLVQEEKAFPRGGANVLTPLEQKQVRAQAERDVLFEQQTGKKVSRSDGDELFDDEETTTERPAKKRRQDYKTGPKEDPGMKIFGLSYKTLVPGSLVLGRITAITSKDIVLALPNNTTGYVPIIGISTKLNQRIEAMVKDENNDEDIELKDLFHVGQWLRAAVSEASDETRSKHIELSIDPLLVNAQLEPDIIASNCFIQASIRSVEDHGVIMDLGLSSGNVKGFISKKELGNAYTIDKLQAGQVMLCIVTGKGSDGKVLKLSPDAVKFWAAAGGKHSTVVSDVPDVEALLPGMAVDVLITDVTTKGIGGKLMGMVDVMADVMHSGAGFTPFEDILTQYKVGSRTKARIIWSLPTDEGNRRIGISLLPHLLAMPTPTADLGPSPTEKAKSYARMLDQALPLSRIVEEAKVVGVVPHRGLYLELPVATNEKAFAHISQISDSRIDELTSTSGKYKIGSTHRARITGFNPVDGQYYVSLQESMLTQAFLRLEELRPGQLVEGKVEKLLFGGTSGLTGVVIKLAAHITALVPSIHMSDVAMQHPEKKFREGFAVKGRVLSIDLEKRQARVTLKKSLVSDNGQVWKAYNELSEGQEAKGTIVKLLEKGALVQYYGQIRGFLPVSEMSEAYVESPSQHFRVGQTVTTRVLSVDAETEQLKVSCKTDSSMDDATRKAWDGLEPGQIVTASVTSLLADKVEVELEGGISGIIRIGQLLDGSLSKAESMHKKLKIGQKLNEVVILSKVERSTQVLLSYKSSFVADAKENAFIRAFKDVHANQRVHGYVQNVTPEGVYVEFAGGTVTLLPKSQVLPESLTKPAFGLRKDQTITAWVHYVDNTRERFTLTMREPTKETQTATKTQVIESMEGSIDASLQSTADITLHRTTKARIVSIKSTQINVRLADNVHGRVDVSEVFDKWEDIKKHKTPLQDCFSIDQIIDVKVLGIRNARGYRFLPFSSRGKGNAVVELSAKPSRLTGNDKLLNGLNEVHEGELHTGFVNNIMDDCVWVNLSPSIRGRVALMDLSDDAGQLQDLAKNFPVGCALRLKVLRVSIETGKLDLTARLSNQSQNITIDSLTAGEVIPGRVTKSTANSVIVQLADNLAAPIPLVELADDFNNANPAQFTKNDIVRVRILNVDSKNKRLSLSLRPSLVLSSSLPVKDTHFSSISQLKPNTLARGFVKHIADKGVLVAISGTVDAFVRIGDLSDEFVKDWQSLLTIDELVHGRILEVDAASKHIRLSLKASQVTGNYVPPVKIDDLEEGQVVTGKVRKVEEFGVFIDIDGTQPRLSGLAHRSEIAERRIADVRGLYSPGDIVKAKVLKVDVENRKISLGLKASYFRDADEDSDEAAGVAVEPQSSEDESDGGIDLDAVQDIEEESAEDMDIDSDEDDAAPVAGLTTSGFDWAGGAMDVASGDDSEPELAPKKKRSKAEVKVDMTGDLDKYGPRSTSDFERQLLGQPNDSGLWIQYMAFHLELSEVQKARDIAERAIRTIHIRDVDEKANVWIALLNLEVEYGDDDTVEETFRRACQVQEPLSMHEKLASIYIDSGRHEKADAVFERIVGNKNFRASPDVWLNYASFLLEKLAQPDRAHALLPRALQSVPKTEHRLLTAKFAALEFRTESGDAERGRTLFEALMSEWPKWTSGWDMWVDIERAQVESDTGAVERVRQLYERSTQAGMKRRRAKFVFKRWLEFEEAHGGKKEEDHVKKLAKEFVEKMQSKDEGDEE